MSTFFSAAFLVTPLYQRFGCRPVAMVGGVLFGTGLVLTAFSPYLITAFVTYAFMPGKCYFVVQVNSLQNKRESILHHKHVTLKLLYIYNTILHLLRNCFMLHCTYSKNNAMHKYNIIKNVLTKCKLLLKLITIMQN